MARRGNLPAGTNGVIITAVDLASDAAVAADWPRIMNTGSMRIDPYAMWELDTATGTPLALTALIALLQALRGFDEEGAVA